MANKMRAIHPGEILRDELEVLNFSANIFAQKLAVPTNRITMILNEQRAITADTAIRLARFFGSTPEFWLNLLLEYDLKTELAKKWKSIKKQVEPYDKKAA